MSRGSRGYARREILAGGALALAGCLAGDDDGDDGTTEDESTTEPEFDRDDIPSFPEVEDPPEAVYKSTHYEGMEMLEPVDAGDMTFGPMVTYPHRFWILTEGDVEPVEPSADEDVHLMVTAWDTETGIVVPVDSGISFDIYRDGEHVGSNNPWLMISQEMGFHFGDNVPLDGDGHYHVEARVPPMTVERTGVFEGRFEEAIDVAFEFEFDLEARDRMVDGVEYIPEEEWGERGALSPMHARHGDDEDGHEDDGDAHESDGENDGHGENDDHESHGEQADDDHQGDHGDHDTDHHAVPYSSVPPIEDLPGSLLGQPETGDAILATTAFEPDNRFAGEEYYVAVSPRTPYNRCVLPMMQLDAVLVRDGSERESVPLRETIDHELDYHYGGAFPDLRSGDELEIQVVAPPQAARHSGYETAFLDMPPVSVDVEL